MTRRHAEAGRGNGTVPSGQPEERPRPIPEIRGFTPPSKKRDPAKKYSAASYAAQFGVPLEDAEELVAKFHSHAEVVRAINRLFSADPDLKRRALNPFSEENRKNEEIRSRDAAEKARRRDEKTAASKAKRDRLRREMLGMPPEGGEEAG